MQATHPLVDGNISSTPGKGTRMCGIVGWLDWERDVSQEAETLERMSARLASRGPDAGGVWLSPRVGFAHRRLIVIDPASGQQPMVHEELGRTCALTFNGEIYNYRELRRELEGRGHRFRGDSDTEVLLISYVEWGERCLDRLRGIFAFAVWEEEAQRLFLARDHLGVKPLFYVHAGSSLLFASEMKALLEHPLVEPVIGAEGLAEIMSLGPLATPGFTVFTQIKELRAGEQMTFERDHVRTRQYWTLESREHEHDLDTTVARLRDLLSDATRTQLVADVPLVTMLSGGLDSSVVSAVAAEEFHSHGKSLATFEIDYPNSQRDFCANDLQVGLDGPWAQQVSEHLGTAHRRIELTSEELIDQLLLPMRAHDAPPKFGQMETSLNLFCRAIKKDAVVALSGEGADELFGGLPWFSDDELLTKANFPWIAIIEKVIPPGLSAMSADVHATTRPDEYVRRRYEEATDEVPRLRNETTADAKRREMFYLELTRWLPMLLDRCDRMSMAAGLEVRVPFLDPQVVQYAWNIPWSMKTIDGIEKGVLRRAFEDLLPPAVAERPKSAYPTLHDPAYADSVRELALAVLNDSTAPVTPLLNVPIYTMLAQGVTMGIAGSFAVTPLERMIQLNGWLSEYEVNIQL